MENPIMQNPIMHRILEKTGKVDLLSILAKTLSFSELNSLLLEVFKIRSNKLTPSELLKSYETNRFVKPAPENPMESLQLELEILKIAASFSFIPIELSPVAPFGACSAVAPANQNKIISALRGTEVVADATNSLALHICHQKRIMSHAANHAAGHAANHDANHAANHDASHDTGRRKADKAGSIDNVDDRMRYCTLHRHVRAQKYDNPRSLPHFKLFCMATSGRDTGSYLFEQENLLEHLQVYRTILMQLAHVEHLKLKLFRIGTSSASDDFYSKLVVFLQEKTHEGMGNDVDIVEGPAKPDNPYYQGLQFKIHIDFEGREREVADGGFVDWSRKLLQNRKERMLISGMGTRLLLNMVKESR